MLYSLLTSWQAVCTPLPWLRNHCLFSVGLNAICRQQSAVLHPAAPQPANSCTGKPPGVSACRSDRPNTSYEAISFKKSWPKVRTKPIQELLCTNETGSLAALTSFLVPLLRLYTHTRGAARCPLWSRGHRYVNNGNTEWKPGPEFRI